MLPPNEWRMHVHAVQLWARRIMLQECGESQDWRSAADSCHLLCSSLSRLSSPCPSLKRPHTLSHVRSLDVFGSRSHLKHLMIHVVLNPYALTSPPCILQITFHINAQPYPPERITKAVPPLCKPAVLLIKGNVLEGLPYRQRSPKSHFSGLTEVLKLTTFTRLVSFNDNL